AGPDEGRSCSPEHLSLQSPAPGAIPPLPDPKADWVRMTYHIAAQGAAGARIDLYANGKFIVRASGDIAADAPFPNTVKFKFGHYRDKISSRASLLVDEVCVSERDATCDPKLVTDVRP